MPARDSPRRPRSKDWVHFAAKSVLAGLALSGLFFTCEARADPQRCSDAPRTPRSTPWSIAAAVVPGALVHGSGHFASGDAQTGQRLLAIEGAGVGTLAAGFLPIVFTGASRRIVGPAAALSVAGIGLFAISWFADLYGVLAPEGGTGAPSTVVPWFASSFGYRYVVNPVFEYRHFMVYELDLRAGAWRVNPSAWFALDDGNARLRARVAYRLTGPLPRRAQSDRDARNRIAAHSDNGGHDDDRADEKDAARDVDTAARARNRSFSDVDVAARDGSFIDIETAFTRHAFGSEHFAVTTGELAVAGRLDMGRVGPRLVGSFAEMSVGAALQAYSYEGPNATKADVSELLLARFAYGMYVGFPGSPRGEVALYYDHRHDGFAAGLKIPGLGSGVAGHFGAEGRYYLTDNWGLAAEVAAGSAYVTGLSLLFRQGEPR